MWRDPGSVELNDLVLSAYPANGEVRAASASSQSPGGEVQAIIDLNEPGALERLARDNPDHYARIRKILAGVDEIPEQAVGRWIKSQFNATQVNYSPYLLTSNPPLKRLSFTLQTTRYEAVLMLTSDGARLLPARRKP